LTVGQSGLVSAAVIGDRTTVEAYALVASALILAIAIVLVATVAHGADLTECNTVRLNDGAYWSWREIDRRKCWYRGQPGRSKALLRWVVPSPRTSAAVDRPEIVTPESSDLGAVSTPTPLEQLAARALSNKEALWQPTTEDQEKAFTCCWPELVTTPATRSVEGNQPIKDQVRYNEPIVIPQATPPARPLWPFMLLMVGLLAGAILLAKRRLT
jgi:hypothetical protein